MIPTFNTPTRRGLLGGGVAVLAAAALGPRAALAVSNSQAESLVTSAVDRINAVISSGKSESAMIGDFQRILNQYADVNIIARSALGPAARSASASEMTAYVNAFSGYIARKYGKRFREFIGGKINVRGSRAVKTWVEVDATADLAGQAPFAVKFLVSDASGKPLFFDLFIEGISLRLTERDEIGAMLDQNRGSISGLTAALQKAG
ncbi:phospholipid-binding protein MlaC [Pseudooceanicola sp. HF7]|uniref:MlaC/ttg2D family ABC transporter substrate-binding protein n=1 Tax=Pseudooceanicola sp. HF7 TaxID=2721560 RepID=UPI00158B1D4C|nr:ABC transporter substrate-binding protein [Pseudooceanicola sp. HF7]